MQAPLCPLCGDVEEAIQEEMMGVWFRCPRCKHEISRPFTGPGDTTFAPDSPLEETSG